MKWIQTRKRRVKVDFCLPFFVPAGGCVAPASKLDEFLLAKANNNNLGFCLFVVWKSVRSSSSSYSIWLSGREVYRLEEQHVSVSEKANHFQSVPLF